MRLSDHDAYRYLRSGLNINLGSRVTDPNDMIDYLAENLARIVMREIAGIVKRKIVKIEARRGPLTKREKKLLARKVLVKRVASVTSKVHSEVS